MNKVKVMMITLALVLSWPILAADFEMRQASSYTSYEIGRYEIDQYRSNYKFAVIRLYDKSTNLTRGYIHFHRSSSTMPTDITYLDSASRIHSHYYSGDFEEILATLRASTKITIRYDSTFDHFYLTTAS